MRRRRDHVVRGRGGRGPGPRRRHPGGRRRPHPVRPVRRVLGPGAGARPRHETRPPGRLRGTQPRGRRARAEARPGLPRRQVRAGARDRQHPPAHRGGTGLRPRRGGRHPDLQRRRAHRVGRRRALHRPVHGSGVPAQPKPAHGAQRPRLLLPGDRGDGRTADERPRAEPDRDPLPGRLVRARGLQGPHPGAQAAQAGGRGDRRLPAQHHGREDGGARPRPQRARGGRHHRRLPAGCRIHPLGAAGSGSIRSSSTSPSSAAMPSCASSGQRERACS